VSGIEFYKIHCSVAVGELLGVLVACLGFDLVLVTGWTGVPRWLVWLADMSPLLGKRGLVARWFVVYWLLSYVEVGSWTYLGPSV
jgi:hypothetical protein